MVECVKSLYAVSDFAEARLKKVDRRLRSSQSRGKTDLNCCDETGREQKHTETTDTAETSLGRLMKTEKND